MTTNTIQMNRAEFEDMDAETRAQYEGYRPGMYVRLEVPDMPCEFVTNFDASYPVIVGALMSGEDSVGYVQVRTQVFILGMWTGTYWVLVTIP